MAVVARFKGGPRNGRKNTLQGNDEAPDRIPVTALEAKNANMKPGRYVKTGENYDRTSAQYQWETHQMAEA